MPKHWQTALFGRFKAIYGNKFTDQFKTAEEHDNHQREWAEAIAGLSGNEIKIGISNCRNDKSWPPSIAEFIALAKESSKDWQHAGQAYKLHQRALPKPVNRTAGRAALQELKAAL